MSLKNSQALVTAIVATTCPTAQAPSVLHLQKSYHLAIYSTTIDVPNGDIIRPAR